MAPGRLKATCSSDIHSYQRTEIPQLFCKVFNSRLRPTNKFATGNLGEASREAVAPSCICRIFWRCPGFPFRWKPLFRLFSPFPTILSMSEGTSWAVPGLSSASFPFFFNIGSCRDRHLFKVYVSGKTSNLNGQRWTADSSSSPWWTAMFSCSFSRAFAVFIRPSTLFWNCCILWLKCYCILQRLYPYVIFSVVKSVFTSRCLVWFTFTMKLLVSSIKAFSLGRTSV